MLWSREPPKLAHEPRKYEPLFAMTKGHYAVVCTLIFHGEYGVEAQFHLNGDLQVGRRFDTRKLAVQWAEQERVARQSDSWSGAVLDANPSLPN